MKVNIGIWDKLSKVVIFLLFLTGLMGVFFWYLPLIKQNQKFREKIMEMDQLIVHQEMTNRSLRASIFAVQNDPLTIERMARERLGYSRPGEIVIKFENDRKAPRADQP
jgi:cell division protein FtsB